MFTFIWASLAHWTCFQLQRKNAALPAVNYEASFSCTFSTLLETFSLNTNHEHLGFCVCCIFWFIRPCGVYFLLSCWTLQKFLRVSPTHVILSNSCFHHKLFDKIIFFLFLGFTFDFDFGCLMLFWAIVKWWQEFLPKRLFLPLQICSSFAQFNELSWHRWAHWLKLFSQPMKRIFRMNKTGSCLYRLQGGTHCH